MKGRCFFILSLGLLFSGCASTKKLGGRTVYAMIYDYSNNAVSGADFYLDGKFIGSSGINGRFMFNLYGDGEKKLHIEKDGCIAIDDLVSWAPSLVLYYRIKSSADLLRMAEKKYDEGLFSEAMEDIDSAITAGGKKDEALYLKALFLSRSGKFIHSNEVLDEMEMKRETEEYIRKLKQFNEESLKNVENKK